MGATSAISNATAIGYFASVTQSNSLVLGGIQGINNAPADTNAGIGTTAPTTRLHVGGGGFFTGDVTINGQGNLGGLRVQKNTAGGTVGSFGSNGAVQVDAAGTAGGRLQVSENSNVGIGTNTTNTKLVVNGGGIYVTNPNTLVITSPNGACWGITVSNTGVLSAFSTPCP